MKYIKYLLLILFIFTYSCLKVNATPVNNEFDDDNFYECVINEYNEEYDENYNFLHNLTDEELSKIKSLDNKNKVCRDITSFKGIEKLTNIEIFKYDYKKNKFNIKKLDFSNNLYLKELYIAGGKINTLDISKNSEIKVIDLNHGEVKINSIMFGDMKLDNLDKNNFNFYGIGGCIVNNLYFNKTEYYKNNINYLFSDIVENKYYSRDDLIIDDINDFDGDYLKAIGKNNKDYLIKIYIIDSNFNNNGVIKKEENVKQVKKKKENIKIKNNKYIIMILFLIIIVFIIIEIIILIIIKVKNM